MKHTHQRASLALVPLIIAAMATAAQAGTWSATSWVDDTSVNSVITPGTYTAAADVTATTVSSGGTSTSGGETINGITFQSLAFNSPGTGTGYDLTYGFVSSGNYNAPLASLGSNPETTALSSSLLFGGSGYTLSLTGLTVGQSYQFSFFSPSWSDGSRHATLSFDDTVGNSYAIDQSGGAANDIITYDYVATSSTQTLTASINTGFGESGTHVFAFANEVEAVPEPSTYALMIGGLGLLFIVLKRRKNQVV